MSESQAIELEIQGAFFAVVAKRKAGDQPGWKWVSSEVVDHRASAKCRDLIVHGGIPGVLKSGPRKGQDKWRGVPLDRVVVTDDEIAAEVRSYELNTGNCSKCRGRGNELVGWSATDGNTFRPCTKCNATGAAPPSQVSEANGSQTPLEGR